MGNSVRGPAAVTAENTQTDNFNLGGGRKSAHFYRNYHNCANSGGMSNKPGGKSITTGQSSKLQRRSSLRLRKHYTGLSDVSNSVLCRREIILLKVEEAASLELAENVEVDENILSSLKLYS